MDFTSEKQRLKGAIDHLKPGWVRQDNNLDNTTRFIYGIDSFDGLLREIKKRRLTGSEEQYAIHRWYNWTTSEVCESIFIHYGAKKASAEENQKNHIDVYINNVPFDIKLSVFPENQDVKKMKLNLAKHFDRNRLIQWFYYNQSKEQRMAYNGRLFMVCEGNSYLEKIALKQDFDQMEIKIKAYMEFLNKENFEFNAVTIKDPSGSSLVKSEIIPLKPYKENFKTLIMKPCPICGKKREITVARINAYRGNIISKCESCYSYNNI